jgi:hypothetical protein
MFGTYIDVAVAADTGIVPACPANNPNCTDPYSPDNYGTCEFVSLINNVITFFIGMASVFAMIVFVYAGYLMVLSQGNAGQVSKAKGMFTNVLIGYVIMLSAFLIVNTIMSMLVGSSSSLLNWGQIECSYSFEAGKPTSVVINLKATTTNGYDLSDAVVVDRYSTTIGGGTGPGNGTCSPISNAASACYPSRLSCFGSYATQASMICNVESRGNPTAVSGTDLCKDGASFSGGLFQVNVLAHYDKLEGCSNNFFTKVGDGVQGDCIDQRNGYCAVRNCSITNGSVYEACMRSTFDVEQNVQIACDLFAASGNDFGPWAYSANKCGLPN